MSNQVDSSMAYIPFSEDRVVAKLIRNRSSLDASFYPTTEPQHLLTTDGVFSLNEDVLCVYADLDDLIERSSLSPMEKNTVQYLMKGYTLQDIAEYLGKTRQTCEVLFKRAVRKIVTLNNSEWERWSGGRLDDE